MSQPILFADIVSVDDTLEAVALRAVLECWNVRVSLHLVGQAADLVQIFDGTQSISKHVILSCHGDERGLLLPELDPSVEDTQPYHTVLTPDNLRASLKSAVS